MKKNITKIKLKDNFHAKPFVKWVGGKKGLLFELGNLAPKEYNDYYEPFLGGGAFFFKLNPHRAFLNDANEALISVYSAIKHEPYAVIEQLEKIRQEYFAQKNDDQRKEMFYRIRSQYNELSQSGILKSALLIFLNKTCFNGMYRENSKGGFNVPFGKHKSPSVFDRDNILAVSSSLKGVALTHQNFDDAVKNCKKGDFVYFDPPYYPLNKTSSFTSYTKDTFLEKEQGELRDTFVKLHKKGCFVMLSNSHTKFIKDLYSNIDEKIQIHKVFAARSINSKGTGRGKIKEVVITNY